MTIATENRAYNYDYIVDLKYVSGQIIATFSRDSGYHSPITIYASDGEREAEDVFDGIIAAIAKGKELYDIAEETD